MPDAPSPLFMVLLFAALLVLGIELGLIALLAYAETMYDSWRKQRYLVYVQELQRTLKTEPPKATPSLTPAEDAGSFRGARWGMTPEEIIEREPSEPMYDGDEFPQGEKGDERQIFFQDHLAGLPCLVSYYFQAESLIACAYTFTSMREEIDAHLRHFADMGALLEQKYGMANFQAGNPDDARTVADSPKEGEPETAICTRSWDVAYASIRLTLRADPTSLSTLVYYADRTEVEIEPEPESGADLGKL